MANNTNTLRTLTKAILEKRCVAIRCDGNSRLITIEPHAVYSDRNNNIFLDFYQQRTVGDERTGKGIWNTTAWRKINAVFWLNTSFSPRLKQGFTPSLDKYQTGLLALVSSGYSPKNNRMLWENIESSIDQLLTNDQTRKLSATN